MKISKEIRRGKSLGDLATCDVMKYKGGSPWEILPHVM